MYVSLCRGQQYDEDGVLIKDWVPELAALPAPLRHAPWTMSAEQQAQYGVTLGVTYPQSMVDPATQTGVLRSVEDKKAKRQKGKTSRDVINAKQGEMELAA